MATLGFLLQNATEKLAAAGIASARYEAREFLCAAYGTDWLHLQLALGEEAGYGLAVATFELYIESRLDGRPMQYILGSTEFYGLTIKCDERALIPRPETEFLADEAVKFGKALGKEKVRALDLCTGTGCLALALSDAGFCTAASDISERALSLAKENADKLELAVNFFQGDLFSALPAGEKFDIIVTNPPYIPKSECQKLSPDVKDHEPILALDGGESGLDLVSKILSEFKSYLLPGGIFLMEIGHDQGAFALENCPGAEILKDLEGHDRIVKFISKEKA